MVLVATGPTEWSQGDDARIELSFTGAREASFVRPLERPAMSLVAHVFRVPLARESPDGLPPGNYKMQVRLIMHGNTPIAASLPMPISVR